MLWLLIYAAGSVQGVLLAVALWQRISDRRANRVLAIWLFVIGIDLALRAWMITEPAAVTFKTERVVSLFPFLHGSLFYLYVRAVIHGRGLGWRDSVHGLGFFVALAINAKYLILNDQEVIAATTALRSGASWPLHLQLSIFLFVYSVSYIAAALIAIRRHRIALRATRSDSHPNAFRWLVVVAIFQCIIWGIALGEWLLPFDWLSFPMVYAAVAAYVLTVGYYSLIYRTDIDVEGALAQSDDDEHVSDTNPIGSVPDEGESAAYLSEVAPADSTHVGAADDPRFDAVEQRLVTLMGGERLFVEPALTIARLARRSGYPEYLVSAVINRRFGCPFWDYVNGYRVAAARDALLDASDTRTALDIAYASGFTSKSTFNAAFKRLLGETPSACRSRAGEVPPIAPVASADSAP